MKTKSLGPGVYLNEKDTNANQHGVTMSHKLGTERAQRGASPALSVRFDDETHAEILELEDLSGQTKSDLIRLFVRDGLDRLKAGQVRTMSRDMEVLWRTVKENEGRVTRTAADARQPTDDDPLDQMANTISAVAKQLEEMRKARG